jgi:hypothetical protein
MNRINGWQRIFAVIAVIWMLCVYPYKNSDRLNIDASQYVLEAMLQGRRDISGDSNNSLLEGITLDDILQSQDRFFYTTTDGLFLTFRGVAIPPETLEIAYQKAKPAIASARLKLLPEYFYEVYFLPLLLLYLLGWSVDWIRRGFKKSSSST